MFYDFECQQDTGTHKVNLAIVQDFEGNEWIFNTIEEFCGFLFDEKHRGYTFIAHNSRGYDAQFVLKWLVDKSIKPYCIYSGTKIMAMEIEAFGISFKDSLNFVLGALAALPKTFGLKELKKGFFPHYFNKPSNENHVGPIPGKKYYGFDQMPGWTRKAFAEWHDFGKSKKPPCLISEKS